MARLIWSPRAVGDLDAICEYIGRDSEAAAREFARQVIALAESIPPQPFPVLTALIAHCIASLPSVAGRCTTVPYQAPEATALSPTPPPP